MIICEKIFERRSDKDSSYSEMEIDIYTWIPRKNEYKEKDHRLSIRKNFKDNVYELIKYYHDSKQIKIEFSNENLQLVLNKASELWNHFHSCWSKEKMNPDIVCEHKGKNIDSLCGYKNKKVEILNK